MVLKVTSGIYSSISGAMQLNGEPITYHRLVLREQHIWFSQKTAMYQLQELSMPSSPAKAHLFTKPQSVEVALLPLFSSGTLVKHTLGRLQK